LDLWKSQGNWLSLAGPNPIIALARYVPGSDALRDPDSTVWLKAEARWEWHSLLGLWV